MGFARKLGGGTSYREQSQTISAEPPCRSSIPLIPVIAFFWERLGVERAAAMGVLREAIAEAMRAKVNELPSNKSKMDDVAEAVAAVRRDLIGELPKMRRAGRTDVSDLAVSVNALTPVSEPLFAVA